MAAVISFLAGYVLGARSGEKSLEDLRSSLRAISQSPEMRQAVASGIAIGRDLLLQGRGVLAERIQPTASTRLHSVA